MARKKSSRKKKAGSRTKSASRKSPTAKKKSSAKAKKSATTRKPAARKKKSVRGKKAGTRGRQPNSFPFTPRGKRGLEAASGGQSGDTQGLSRREDEDSESVEELAEEGQYFEAEAVSGVENAKDPDEGEVTTSEVPEDDVPPEYWDDQDKP